MTVTSNNPQSWLETIWNALHMAREDCIPESNPDYDNQWNDICEAMAWLTESLGLELNDSGDYEDAKKLIDELSDSRDKWIKETVSLQAQVYQWRAEANNLQAQLDVINMGKSK
jgi:hypothetical protein